MDIQFLIGFVTGCLFTPVIYTACYRLIGECWPWEKP